MPEGSFERPAGAESGEIATSTLAEIYAQQGLLGRALSIYRRMLNRAPQDAEITSRIESLERRIAEAGPTSDERIAEIEAQRAGSRERLPWDPPEPPRATGPPEATRAEPFEAGPATSPEAESARSSPARSPRVGPMDSRSFAAWLEGR